jgi:hypothetical protein
MLNDLLSVVRTGAYPWIVVRGEQAPTLVS